ncbi:MAG: hypothetical protein J0I91_16365 [Candidatus Accumulibacter sp.]|nr:hypothetical protein [Accumulibacter sp.]
MKKTKPKNPFFYAGAITTLVIIYFISAAISDLNQQVRIANISDTFENYSKKSKECAQQLVKEKEMYTTTHNVLLLNQTPKLVIKTNENKNSECKFELLMALASMPDKNILEINISNQEKRLIFINKK